MADMPTKADIGMLMPEFGNTRNMMVPIIAPPAPPMVSKGASVPPEVPLPNAIAHDKNLKNQSRTTTAMAMVPDNTLIILS